jgi:aminoglycoside phosphotransferase (APT) family kinase protein
MKGWSSDRKYRICLDSGETLLLRLSDVSRLESKRKEFEIIRKYAALGFPMSRPIEFGVRDDQVYMLLSWVDGEDLETVLPRLSEAEQYRLGREAGLILKKIHSIPVEPENQPKQTKRVRRLWQLSQYEESQLRLADDETAVQYVKDNIDLIWTQPPVYQHGDFHPGNLIYRKDGSIGVIDFNRWEVGDPWEEFYKLQSFGKEVSVPYCVGEIDAYFDGYPPEDFWRALAVYVAWSSLFSIKWAEPFGPEEIAGMARRCKAAFADYDTFRRCVPKWYAEKLRASWRRI